MSVTGPEQAGAGDRDVSVVGPVVVTDTELSLLESAHRRRLGEPVPGGEPRDRAGDGEDEALRSLVARGLLDADGELQEDDEVRMVLSAVLDVRVLAPRVLLVERIVAGADAVDDGRDAHARQADRLVHLVPSGACVEDVLPDGVHHLYLVLDPGDVVRCVTDVTVPTDAAEGVGPRRVLASSPEDLARTLGRPTSILDLSVLTRAPEGDDAAGPGEEPSEPERSVSHLVALGPAGSWVADLDRGRPLPPSLDFRPVHPEWVEQWVCAVLDDARTTGWWSGP